MNNKDEKAEKKTCRHFRYMIPNEVANELYFGDLYFCEVCEPYVKRLFKNLDTYSEKISYI